MIFNLLGYSRIDYVSKKTNKRVTGLNVYLSQEITKNGEGYSCEAYYISSQSPAYYIIQDLTLGSEVEVYFDKYGKIQKIIEA